MKKRVLFLVLLAAFSVCQCQKVQRELTVQPTPNATVVFLGTVPSNNGPVKGPGIVYPQISLSWAGNVELTLQTLKVTFKQGAALASDFSFTLEGEDLAGVFGSITVLPQQGIRGGGIVGSGLAFINPKSTAVIKGKMELIGFSGGYTTQRLQKAEFPVVAYYFPP